MAWIGPAEMRFARPISGSMPSMWRKRCGTPSLEADSRSAGETLAARCCRVHSTRSTSITRSSLINFAQAHFDDFARRWSAPCGPQKSPRRAFRGARDRSARISEYVLRPAKVEETVHRGADGAAGIEHIVHENQIFVVHGKSDIAGLQHGLRGNFGKVVAIERDVQRADGHFHAVDFAHGLRDAQRKRNSAAANANQRQIRRAAASLHNFVRHALQACGRFPWRT